MKTAATYARVSSDKQKEENTIASQTAALIAFAGERQFEVPREWVFEGDGYSGARRSAMRAGVRANKLRDGGYRLVNGRNRVVAGERYDLEAQQVIDFCREREARRA